MKLLSLIISELTASFQALDLYVYRSTAPETVVELSRTTRERCWQTDKIEEGGETFSVLFVRAVILMQPRLFAPSKRAGRRSNSQCDTNL